MSDLFHNRGVAHHGVLSLSPREAYGLADSGLIIVDLRNPDYLAYKAFDVLNVISLTIEQFDQGIAALDPVKY